MKPLKQFALACLLIAAGTLTAADAEKTTDKFTPAQTQAALDVILTRTSVRAYQKKDVEAEKITILLKAAMAAPSAMNRQPWRFVVIRSSALKKEIAEKLKNAWMVGDAPLAVVVCGDMSKRIQGDGADFWVQDLSAATENLLLAAHAQNLGAVWCGLYPSKERSEIMRKLLGLPENLVPLNVIAIGYPAAAQTPKNKWNESLIQTR